MVTVAAMPTMPAKVVGYLNADGEPIDAGETLVQMTQPTPQVVQSTPMVQPTTQVVYSAPSPVQYSMPCAGYSLVAAPSQVEALYSALSFAQTMPVAGHSSPVTYPVSNTEVVAAPPSLLFGGEPFVFKSAEALAKDEVMTDGTKTEEKKLAGDKTKSAQKVVTTKVKKGCC